MAVAEIIGAAVGVLLLVIVAYLLIGGTLSMAETVATAQKDLTTLQEARLKTSITVSNAVNEAPYLNFTVKNTGNEIISDFTHMDVYSYDVSNGYIHYTYDKDNTGNVGTWSIIRFEKDLVHIRELDPDDIMTIWAIVPGTYSSKTIVQVTTSNGVQGIASVT